MYFIVFYALLMFVPKLIERTYAVAVGLEYAIMKVQVNQVGMKLNGT
jgi:ribosomal protein S19